MEDHAVLVSVIVRLSWSPLRHIAGVAGAGAPHILAFLLDIVVSRPNHTRRADVSFEEILCLLAVNAQHAAIGGDLGTE
jgi:hypothetical protein